MIQFGRNSRVPTLGKLCFPAEMIWGSRYKSKDQYGRDVNSIHERPTYLPGMRFCHDPSDIVDTEDNLTRSAWVYSTNQPVYAGGFNCGVNGGRNAYDTMALYRDQQDQPVYQLLSPETQNADPFGAEVELIQKETQSRNRPYGFTRQYYNGTPNNPSPTSATPATPMTPAPPVVIPTTTTLSRPRGR